MNKLNLTVTGGYYAALQGLLREVEKEMTAIETQGKARGLLDTVATLGSFKTIVRRAAEKRRLLMPDQVIEERWRQLVPFSMDGWAVDLEDEAEVLLTQGKAVAETSEGWLVHEMEYRADAPLLPGDVVEGVGWYSGEFMNDPDLLPFKDAYGNIWTHSRHFVYMQRCFQALDELEGEGAPVELLEIIRGDLKAGREWEWGWTCGICGTRTRTEETAEDHCPGGEDGHLIKYCALCGGGGALPGRHGCPCTQREA